MEVSKGKEPKKQQNWRQNKIDHISKLETINYVIYTTEISHGKEQSYEKSSSTRRTRSDSFDDHL